MKGIFRKAGEFTGRVADTFTAEQTARMIEQNAAGLSVGILGRLGRKYKSAFTVTLTRYVNKRLIVEDKDEEGMAPEEAQTLKAQVMNFLHSLPDWQANLYMLHVSLGDTEEQRMDIIDDMFTAADDHERQLVIDEIVGDKPFVAKLGEKIKEEWANPDNKDAGKELLYAIFARFGTLTNFFAHTAPAEIRDRYERFKIDVDAAAERLGDAGEDFRDDVKRPGGITPLGNTFTGKDDR